MTCFAAKKRTFARQKILGGVLFFKSMFLHSNILPILILIILFIIIIRHLQHTARYAIEKSVCSKLHNRFFRYFKINDLACAGCAVFWVVKKFTAPTAQSQQRIPTPSIKKRFCEVRLFVKNCSRKNRVLVSLCVISGNSTFAMRKWCKPSKLSKFNKWKFYFCHAQVMQA